MRPLLLRIQAFGPFAGRELVDFRPLGRRALFLIHGPTGAGKSSLLDAMCYALYGESSGQERDPRDLRCDRAAAELATEVELEFTLGSDHLRVVRAPAQTRPRLRGSGTTEAPATAVLERRQGDGWQVLAHQPAKVGALVQQLLGFSSPQFRQVIMLPQGRFRELLVAGSDQREAILQQLFQTSLFRQVEAELKERTRALAGDAAAARNRREAVLDSLGLAEGDAPDEALRQLEAACVQAAAAVDAARLLRQSQALRLQQAELAHQRVAALASARDALARQLDAGAARDRDAATLASALRALQVQSAMDRWQAARQQRDHAFRDAQAAGLEAARMRRAHEQAIAALAQARTRATGLDARKVALAELERLALPLAELATLASTIQAARADAEAQARRLAALERELGEQQAAHAAALAGLEQARQAELQVAHGRVDLERALQWQRLGEAREQAEAGRQQAAITLAAAVQADEQAQAAQAGAATALQSLEIDWRSGQAARLAAGLQDGQPCPVCGSTHHPLPAQGTGAAISDERLAQAQGALQRQEQTLRQRNAALAAARGLADQAEQRLAQAQAACAEFGTPPPAPLTELRARQSSLEGEAARASELQARLDALALAVAGRSAQVRDLAAARAGSDARIAALSEQKEALEGRLPADLRTSAAVAARQASLQADLLEIEAEVRAAEQGERAAFAALQQGDAGHLAAQARLEQADGELAAGAAVGAQALAAQGFADEPAWRQAWLDEHDRAALDAAIRAHDAATAAARAEVSRCEAEAGQLPAPELGPLREADSAAAQQLEAASAEAGRLDGERTRLRQVIHQVQALAQAQRQAEQRLAVVGRLSEVASGNNRHRMTLQRYVLATLLDEVLEAASQRLLRMSRQRFLLQRMVGVKNLQQAGGLELEVVDGETGHARPVATLSGGEGFLAALSLALGLAEVVQSRSGGIHLETLFVDEGFGTLDPESLDIAISTLIDLQREGRLVGIISHVAELRERIDVRLEVRAAGQGSRTCWELGAHSG